MKACKSENIGVDKFAYEKVELKVGADQAGAGSEVDESVAANNGSKFDGAEVVMVETGELKLNPESTKIYGDQIVPSLLKSIEDEGIRTPLKVDRHTKIVLAGNARLRVAMELGITKLPVIYTNDSDSPLELVATNVAREKTLEAKIREFEIYVPQEKEKTKMRRRSKVPKLEPSKSRDRAAQKVGLSASSLEMGMKVLKVITALEDEKDIGQAETLRKTLNNEGINAARKLSIKFDAIKPKNQANGGARKVKSEAQADNLDVNEDDQWEHGAKADNHIRALQSLATYCRGGEIASLDKVTKEKLQKALNDAIQAIKDANLI